MSTRKRPHTGVRDLCAHLHDDDGFESHDRGGRGPREDRAEDSRKDRQLCKQARRALDTALACSASPLLRRLMLTAVEPAPDSRRLRVVVAPADAASGPGEDAILRALRDAAGYLRSEVAAAITRKRTPALIFAVGPSPLDTWEAADET